MWNDTPPRSEVRHLPQPPGWSCELGKGNEDTSYFVLNGIDKQEASARWNEGGIWRCWCHWCWELGIWKALNQQPATRSKRREKQVTADPVAAEGAAAAAVFAGDPLEFCAVCSVRAAVRRMTGHPGFDFGPPPPPLSLSGTPMYGVWAGWAWRGGVGAHPTAHRVRRAREDRGGGGAIRRLPVCIRPIGRIECRSA
jgi:hypothetical protein